MQLGDLISGSASAAAGYAYLLIQPLGVPGLFGQALLARRTDTDELVAGTDPNVAGSASIAEATPQYGCGATIAVNRPVTGQSATFVAAVVAAAALTLRLRSRRPARERARR